MGREAVWRRGKKRDERGKWVGEGENRGGVAESEEETEEGEGAAPWRRVEGRGWKWGLTHLRGNSGQGQSWMVAGVGGLSYHILPHPLFHILLGNLPKLNN